MQSLLGFFPTVDPQSIKSKDNRKITPKIQQKGAKKGTSKKKTVVEGMCLFEKGIVL